MNVIYEWMNDLMNELATGYYLYWSKTTVEECMFIMNALPTDRQTDQHSLIWRCEDASKQIVEAERVS